jgi:hypothetical protein
MKRAIIFLFSLVIFLAGLGETGAWGRGRGYYYYPRGYYYGYRPYYRPYSYYPRYYYPAAYNPYFYPRFYDGVSVFYSSPGFGFRIGPGY